MQITSISGSALAQVLGLPYTVGHGWGGTINITGNGNTTPLHFFAHEGNTNILLRNTSNGNQNWSSYSGDFFYVSGHYYIA